MFSVKTLNKAVFQMCYLKDDDHTEILRCERRQKLKLLFWFLIARSGIRSLCHLTKITVAKSVFY